MKDIHVRIAAVVALLAGVLMAGPALAQETTILQGKVVDAVTGEPLIGAQVVIAGTDLGTVTDVDGRYRLQVPRGTYSLDVQYLGYASKTVTEISVAGGQPAHQNVTLEAEAIVAEGIRVVITSEEETGSVAGALSYQRHATAVVNGISSEEISRTPASNAADAATRVVSTSIMDGRYVYVRGLGERYSTARLDGSTLPTPEPEKRVLPLDIFPSNLIESLFTVKSYTADLPGDFAGGLVDIQTKDIPDERFLRIGTSVGFNTNFSGHDYFTYPGSSTDWLGFDDGERGLPTHLPDQIPVTASPTDVANLHSLFRSGFGTDVRSPGIGEASKSVSVSLGDRIEMFGREGGYLAGLTYGYSSKAREQADAFPSLAADLIQYDYDALVGSREVSIGGIAGLGLNLTPTDRISWKTLVTQSAEDEARRISGPFDQSTSGFALIDRLQFVERTLVSTKLSGKHKIDRLRNASLGWNGSYAFARRHEPDTRQTSYLRPLDRPEAAFTFNEAGSNSRFFSDLTDHMVQGSAKLEQQLDLFGRSSSLDVGLTGGYRTRDFGARRFAYEGAAPSVRNLPPSELFTNENIAAGLIRFLDVTEPTDEYDATEQSAAGFASLEIVLSPSWSLTTGVRLEQNDTEVRSFDPRTGGRDQGISSSLSTVEPMPTATLTWNATPNQVVKLAAARTIVRPQFRELAPFRYDNYQESTLGNPFLVNGEIYNADLRWSLFPSLGEIVSAGVFYKHFNDPIEIVRLPTGGTNVGTPEPYNGPSARSYGVEIELRQDLGRLADALAGFGTGVNVSLVHSKVQQDESVKVYFGGAGETADILDPAVFTNDSRSMTGQSPYLVNASLFWSRADGGTTATLLYNGVGERITQVGVQGYDDIYEQPRHTFDLTLTQSLGALANLKLGVENLTDSKYEFKLGDFVTRSYETGRQISLSITSNL